MQNFILHHQYFGFELMKKEELPDISATGYLMHHIKSGANLCYLQSADQNKVFSICFKTPPQDDCGTPHILEHSVLCGSRKYQAKDPFNELAKGSLNTFLNALTYADKTMYPIASCNEKDFRNMMDVYLDAVFFPNIYQKKGIFLQEGWRYETTAQGTEVTGVVFNEMKGALSDPESRLANVIARSMFGETTYGFESGGDPNAIVDLTYAEFLDFHRRYYHPSNAYLYLYGNMDILSCLEYLDQEYLSHFDCITELPVIRKTTVPRPSTWISETYPIQEQEQNLDTGYFAYNCKVGSCTDTKRILAMQLLGYLLLETNASPLKNALRDAGICEEAEGYFDSSTFEMVFSIIAKRGKRENAEAFRSVVDQTLQKIVKEGFEADLLEGGIKKLEFTLREEDYGSRPKGLVYHSRQMKSWLHGEDPFAPLHQLQIWEELKQDITAGILQVLIQELFLDNTEKTWVVFLPEVGKQQKEETAFRAKIQNRIAQISNTLLQADQDALAEFQNTIDTPEILGQIPLLELEDVDPNPQEVVYQKHIDGGMEWISVPLESHGICYIQLLFHTEKIPYQWIPYTGLLAEVLGKVDTRAMDFLSLSQETDRIFGNFSVSNDIYSKNKRQYQSFLTYNGKVLVQDLEEAFHFIQEIMFYSHFQSIESLKKIIQSALLKYEYMFQNYAHFVAIYRSRAAIASGAAVKELVSGIAYYQFLKEIRALLETNPEMVAENLRKTAEQVFCRENMTAVIGCEASHIPEISQKIRSFFSNLPMQKAVYNLPKIPTESRQMAFSISSGVQYNIKSWDLEDLHTSYTGKLQVLKTVLNLEYLWNAIRIQGGAYGCGCNFQRNGGMYFYSYRDPNIKRTYSVYNELAKKLETFTADKREMTKYILGTINRFDQPKTNSEWLEYVAAIYFSGISHAQRCQERMEILKTTADDIRNFTQMMQEFSKTNNICTIGGEEKIQAEVDLFQELDHLIS